MIQPHETKIRFKDTLYGREAEFSQLEQAYEQNVANKRHIAIVKGVSGIGKTSFVSSFGHQKIEENVIFVSGKQDLNRDNPPYTAVIQAFSSLLEEWLLDHQTGNKKIKAVIEEELGANLTILKSCFPRLIQFFDNGEDQERVSNNYRDRFNEALLSFTRVINRLDQQVVIFLDDLQWGDEGTINFLRMWLSEGNAENLFWIGSFRTDEINSEIWLLTEEIILSNYKSQTSIIKLNGLTLDGISEMIGDVFKMQSERLDEFSELILQITGGNPLFIKESLYQLIEDEAFYQHDSTLYWDYKVAKIKSLDRGARILEFMIKKLEGLPEETINYLGVGAAMGSHFNLAFISAAVEKSSDEVEDALRVALDLNIITEVNPNYGSFATRHYKFIHDKMQTAADVMVSDDRRKWIHHAIGKIYESSLGYAAQDRNIYDIVNQFNRCPDYFESYEERLKLAKMNLRAGKKAKATSAFEQALSYFKNVIQLFEDQKTEWDNNLVYEVYLESGEAAYLQKDFVSSVMYFESALKFAKNKLQHAKIHYNFLIMYNDVRETEAAWSSAMAALTYLGFSFPEEISKIQLLRLFRKVKRKAKKYSPISIVEMKQNTSEVVELQVLTLLEMMSPAWNLNVKTLSFVALKNFELTLDKGLSSGSYFGVIGFGTFLGRYSGKIVDGWKWIQAGQAIAKKYDKTAFHGKAMIAGDSVYGHIIRSFEDNKHALNVGFQMAKSSADYLTAAFTSLTLIENCLLSGMTLNQLEEGAKLRTNFLQRIENKEYKSAHDAILLIPQVLKEQADNFDFYNQLIADKHKRLNAYHLQLRWLIVQLFLAVVLKRQEMVEQLLENKALFNRNGVTPIQIIRIVSIANAAVQGQNTIKKARVLKTLKEFKNDINTISEVNEANFKHILRFLEGAEYELRNKTTLAIEAYKNAVELSVENGFIHFAAIFNERLFGLYQMQGDPGQSNLHLKDAIRFYKQWGATLKVIQLSNLERN